MTIDSDTDIANADAQTTDTSTPDTASADTGTALNEAATVDGDALASQTSPDQGAAPAGQVTKPGMKPAVPAGALTTPQPKPNPTQTQQPPDFRKELLDQKAQWGRERQQMATQLEQLQQQAQQWQADRQKQEAEANRLKLKPWSPQHPENARTRERLTNVKAYMSAMEAASPEQQNDAGYRQALARKMGVTADDARLHDEWQQHRDHTIADFSADPDGFVANLARQVATPMIQQALQQFQSHMQAVQEVQRDLGDMEAIKPYAPMLADALQNGVPYEYALKLAAQQREIDSIKGTVGDAQRTKAVAEERMRLQKQGASVTRDPRGAGLPDLYELAKKEADKEGLSYDSPKFIKILSRLEASLKST